MRIEIQRTGGFTGIPLTATFDTADLPPEWNERIDHLLAEASFFDLPEVIPSATEGADRFQYVVKVATEEGEHTVEVSEGAVPEALRPLLDALLELARSRR